MLSPGLEPLGDPGLEVSRWRARPASRGLLLGLGPHGRSTATMASRRSGRPRRARTVTPLTRGIGHVEENRRGDDLADVLRQFGGRGARACDGLLAFPGNPGPEVGFEAALGDEHQLVEGLALMTVDRGEHHGWCGQGGPRPDLGSRATLTGPRGGGRRSAGAAAGRTEGRAEVHDRHEMLPQFSQDRLAPFGRGLPHGRLRMIGQAASGPAKWTGMAASMGSRPASPSSIAGDQPSRHPPRGTSDGGPRAVRASGGSRRCGRPRWCRRPSGRRSWRP